jgi:hypothetical protein
MSLLRSINSRQWQRRLQMPRLINTINLKSNLDLSVVAFASLSCPYNHNSVLSPRLPAWRANDEDCGCLTKFPQERYKIQTKPEFAPRRCNCAWNVDRRNQSINFQNLLAGRRAVDLVLEPIVIGLEAYHSHTVKLTRFWNFSAL